MKTNIYAHTHTHTHTQTQTQTHTWRKSPRSFASLGCTKSFHSTPPSTNVGLDTSFAAGSPNLQASPEKPIAS